MLHDIGWYISLDAYYKVKFAVMHMKDNVQNADISLKIELL